MPRAFAVITRHNERPPPPNLLKLGRPLAYQPPSDEDQEDKRSRDTDTDLERAGRRPRRSLKDMSSDMSHARTIELHLLERKIKSLVNKLKKQHNIQLEVFDHDVIRYGETLGKGGEGVVQKCVVLYNDLEVNAAVKTVINNSDDALNITLDEIELLCLARDPIIPTTLQVYGVAAVPEKTDPTKGHLVIITEVGEKNALQLYQDEPELIPAHVTLDIWSRLAAAMHCIHCKQIMHQDLKPENILITRIIRDSYGQVEKVDLRVIDLGMAQHLDADRVYTDDLLGTTGYHAPEVLFDDSYDMTADIFVLGITYCVMLLPPDLLRKPALEAFLKKLHETKKRRLVGRKLFENALEPAISTPLHALSPCIKTMLCTMLEGVDKRNITLLDIARRCGEESIKLREEFLRATPSHAGRGSASASQADAMLTRGRTRQRSLPATVHTPPASSTRQGRRRKRRRRYTSSSTGSSFATTDATDEEEEEEEEDEDEDVSEDDEEPVVTRRTRSTKSSSTPTRSPARKRTCP